MLLIELQIGTVIPGSSPVAHACPNILGIFCRSGPGVIKLFSCSTEHKIFHANKSQITNNAKFFLAKYSCA